MTEMHEAETAFKRMTEADQQVIAATVNMMLRVYASMRIPQLEAQAQKNQTEPKKEETE